ncbi:uncharacterized protein N0V96_009954 [Colletotrichum fioriniae]|uniref:uncharacterized protein n=1 Tax=Colletotrichum fioriniae TaxID=710243 RepID=UPI0032DA8148|nr:hypothetical protein N0V96_009954 [Colletotrichum fioriniae]
MKEVLLELEESVANANPSPTDHAAVEGPETWISPDRGHTGLSRAKKARSDDGKPDIDHDTTALQHVRCYIEFLEEKIMPMNSMFLGTDKLMIRFDDLWYLFTHGEIIYTNSTPSRQTRNTDDIDQGGDDESFQTTFILHHRNYSWPDDLPLTERKMYLWGSCIDHNGKTFGPRMTAITIKGWSGKKDIRQLPAYPLRFRENVEEFKDMLQERANKFKACLKQRHVAYDGWTVLDPLLQVSYREEAPLYIDGDIVIDFGEALRNQPSWIPHFDFAASPKGPSWVYEVDKMPIWHWPNPVADKDWGKPYESIRERMIKLEDTETELERVFVETTNPFFTAHKSDSNIKTLDGIDPVYNLILPRRILAYSLRQRQFVAVDVRSMEIKTHYPDIFASLSIDERHRQIVQCLVAEHFEKREMERRQPYSRSMSQDIVHGKGSGLSILLHGVPGVGKTATAEAVAQANDKPLFAITCGDLGITPQLVEQNLNEIFRLAHLWDCVLLFDEADVFLTRRNTQNLERSALVSVFLRVMEYYRGILFLTTNRVGALDEAFKSRIHVSLYYEPLSKDQTIAIFRANIETLREIGKRDDRPPIDIKDEGIIAYAKEHFATYEERPHLRWNGRQIRNAFQVAASLARHSSRGNADQSVGPALNASHFEQVSRVVERFGSYMVHAQASTDSDQARTDSLRADNIRNEQLDKDEASSHPRRTDDFGGGVSRPLQKRWRTTNSDQEVPRFSAMGNASRGLERF